uniref:Thymidine kinase n=1 Tax=Human herpesvirus 1 TaxID=10298 RepID=Q9ENS4_HHV1|nr:thymidine kinase [Human alphaherpesvirus 1]
MASYPCHQHASAFDQAARSRGHSNRRTALRPRRQQEATEVRLEQKMPTLLRVYIDGPHGMGKTTTTQLLVALGSRDDIVYVPEPMTYWQVLGASETIANIYTTQHRLDQGEISAGDAAVVMTSAQITMGMPYAVTDAVLAPHIGGEAGSSHAPPPALTLIFDRHPIAALLCYPAARYLMGSMTPRPCWRSWPSSRRPCPAQTSCWGPFRRTDTSTAWPNASAPASGLTWLCWPRFAAFTGCLPIRCGICRAAGRGGRIGDSFRGRPCRPRVPSPRATRAHDPISGTRYLPCFGPPSCWPPTATCITCLPGPWTSWPNASVPCTSLSWITTNRPPAAGTPCCNLPPGWSRPTSPPQAPYRRSATWRARLPGRWGRLTETRKETIPEGTRAMTAIKRQNKTHGCWVVCS